MISMPSQTVNNLIMTALKRAKRLHITESSFYRFHVRGSRGKGDSAYERGGDARRKFWVKPLKETHLDVAQAFFDL